MSLLLLFRSGATDLIPASYLPAGLTLTTAVLTGQTQTGFIAGGATTSTAVGAATATVAIDSGQRGADLL